MPERQHASSGCKGTVTSDWADLACNLWPHDADPTASHWDADAGIWWQTEDQRTAHVAHNRAMSQYMASVDAQQATAITRLEELAREMLGSFIKTGDGHRARAGQVQIAKWQERLEQAAAQPCPADCGGPVHDQACRETAGRNPG